MADCFDQPRGYNNVPHGGPILRVLTASQSASIYWKGTPELADLGDKHSDNHQPASFMPAHVHSLQRISLTNQPQVNIANKHSAFNVHNIIIMLVVLSVSIQCVWKMRIGC